MQLTRKLLAPVILIAAYSLASCSDDVANRGDPGDERTAAGEVRGGTISDDMLPLDSVQSQSPPLRSATVSNVASGAEEDTGSPEAEGTAEPATSPDAAGAEPPAQAAEN